MQCEKNINKTKKNIPQTKKLLAVFYRRWWQLFFAEFQGFQYVTTNIVSSFIYRSQRTVVPYAKDGILLQFSIIIIITLLLLLFLFRHLVVDDVELCRHVRFFGSLQMFAIITIIYSVNKEQTTTEYIISRAGLCGSVVVMGLFMPQLWFQLSSMILRAAAFYCLSSPSFLEGPSRGCSRNKKKT